MRKAHRPQGDGTSLDVLDGCAVDDGGHLVDDTQNVVVGVIDLKVDDVIGIHTTQGLLLERGIRGVPLGDEHQEVGRRGLGGDGFDDHVFPRRDIRTLLNLRRDLHLREKRSRGHAGEALIVGDQLPGASGKRKAGKHKHGRKDDFFHVGFLCWVGHW